MEIQQWRVDAFAERPFTGNPAAVCLLEAPITDRTAMAIAQENNYSETAFLTKKASGRYGLRWFTPECEINLCGHATLASGFVAMEILEPGLEEVRFDTLSGELAVAKRAGLFELDFPAYEIKPVPVTEEMAAAFGARPQEAWMSRDLLCVFKNEEAVRSLEPDQALLAKLPGLLQHATAISAAPEFECVSRSFAPKCGIAEDPVCGSAHCSIAPYWFGKLGKAEITGWQASRRGGALHCRTAGPGRLKIAGAARLFSRDTLYI